MNDQIETTQNYFKDSISKLKDGHNEHVYMIDNLE
jgi:hypothetical protein